MEHRFQGPRRGRRRRRRRGRGRGRRGVLGGGCRHRRGNWGRGK